MTAEPGVATQIDHGRFTVQKGEYIAWFFWRRIFNKGHKYRVTADRPRCPVAKGRFAALKRTSCFELGAAQPMPTIRPILL